LWLALQARSLYKKKTIHRRAQRTQGARSLKNHTTPGPSIFIIKTHQNSAIFWIASSLLLQVLRLFYRGIKKTAKTSKLINYPINS